MRDSNATVFVVDDDQAICDGICQMVETIGLPAQSFPSPIHFLDHYDGSSPGCLILDVRMPGMSGLELQAHLYQQDISIPIIFISGHGDIPMAVEAIKAGAMHFIEKPFRDQELLDCVQESIKLDQTNRKRLKKRRELKERMSQLTERESQILANILDGKTTKLIAHELKISPKTVDFHRIHIMQKMGHDTSVCMMKEFMKAGLL